MSSYNALASADLASAKTRFKGANTVFKAIASSSYFLLPSWLHFPIRLFQRLYKMNTSAPDEYSPS